MTTIEERANQLYCDKDGYVKDSANDYMRLGYIRGAAQQKALDAKEYRKDMRYVNVKRQELIGKVLKEFTKILLECNFEEQWAMTLTKEFKERIMEE